MFSIIHTKCKMDPVPPGEPRVSGFGAYIEAFRICFPRDMLNSTGA